MIPPKSKTVAWIFSLFIIILVPGLAGLRIYAQPVSYEVNTIPLTGELANFSGRCFLEDNEGFIWFGSWNGLYRYHGTGVKVFRNVPGDSNSLSGNFISRLHEDGNGIIWIATDKGLNRFDRKTESFTWYRNVPGDTSSLNSLNDIVEDREGYLWIATRTGFSRFDKVSGEFRNFMLEHQYSPNSQVRVLYLYLDQQDSLWIFHQAGVDIFDKKTERLRHIADVLPQHMIQDRSGNLLVAATGLNFISREQWLKGDYLSGTTLLYDNLYPENTDQYIIQNIAEDESGNLWMRKLDGLYCYSRNLDTLFFWKHPYPYPNTGIDNNLMGELFIDSKGHIWFYTREGIHQVVKKHRNFRVYEFDPKDSEIAALALENKNMIWFGTTHALYSLDRTRNKYTFHYGDTWDIGFSSKKVNRLFVDSKGTLWAGMLYEGLFRSEGSDNQIRQFVKYPPLMIDSITGDTFNLSWIRQIFEDSRGRIWIGTKNGPICYYDEAEDLFIRLVDNPGSRVKLPPKIQVRHESPSGILWASGPAGLYRIIPPFINVSQTEIMASDVHQCKPSPGSGIGSIHGHSTLFMDSTGCIWLATGSRGLYKLTEQNNPGIPDPTFLIDSFRLDDGLPSNTIRSFLPGRRGDIWIGTTNGLSNYNPQYGTFTNYYLRHGLPSNQFLHESAARDPSGELFFGTSRGIVSFHPDSLRLNRDTPPVRLTDFRIDNRSVLPGENSPLKKSILYSNSIELRHNQDNITLEYAILNYEQPGHNWFRYILEGLEDEWVDAGNRSRIDYTNLKPGRYTFRVMGSNNDGFWNEAGASLQIRIHPPPWQTWWAYTVYGFILLGIILLYRRYLLNRAKLQTAVEIERMEKEKVEEIDHMRSRFFANISHEFRTPLTLLLGPIEDLKKNLPELSSKNKGMLQTMKRNARRLQHLVNQLLDISKLETGKVKLQVSEGNLTEFIRTIVISFLSLAESKSIRYEYDLPELPDLVYFDRDKLEKILTNLVSNAFKFTPNGGSINITLKYISSEDSDAPSFAEISVQDTGKGIPAEKLEKIFDRFYQVSDSDSREQEGTGIGLALTNELVDLYKGEIHAESEPGTGSIFTVKLPVSKMFFKEDEIMKLPSGEEKKPVEPMVDSAELKRTDFPEAHTGGKDKAAPVVLVVEDNTDLRNYISQNLDNEYHILEAENGREGFAKATENIPDLVITDLMMPLMDGMELSRILKRSPHTNHIPVIMLTAKADRESKLKGLRTGADDYLIKPFDAEELRVRTHNLIEQRQKLREKFQEEFKVKPLEETVRVPGDKLLQKILAILRQNIGNPQFKVDSLPGDLNMSRTQMFRKIAALTGGGPKDLLRIMRLKKAAELILTGKMNITQVMYEVGFQTPSYFASSFREYFGVNPTEYKKSLA